MIVVSRGRVARGRVRSLGDAPSGRGGGLRPWMSAALQRLAVPGDVDRIAGAVPAGALVSVSVSLWVAGPAGVVALAIVAAAGYLALERSAPARRAAAAERQLPGVLESVARHLRAGGSVAQALAATTPPAPGDLQDSWRRLVALIPHLGVEAALDDWCRWGSARPAGAGVGASAAGRWADQPVPSIPLAASALALAVGSGGSAARAVDGVAATIRSRLAVAEELRALSSQARASAAVIGLAPVVFGAAAAATDDRTVAFLSSPMGLATLATGLGLDALGAWWMARLCRPPVAA